jgi:glutathione peroxidase-family protein
MQGKATLVVNTKTEDPEAIRNLPALTYLNEKYGGEDLRIWLFPTEQVGC